MAVVPQFFIMFLFVSSEMKSAVEWECMLLPPFLHGTCTAHFFFCVIRSSTKMAHKMNWRNNLKSNFYLNVQRRSPGWQKKWGTFNSSLNLMRAHLFPAKRGQQALNNSIIMSSSNFNTHVKSLVCHVELNELNECHSFDAPFEWNGQTYELHLQLKIFNSLSVTWKMVEIYEPVDTWHECLWNVSAGSSIAPLSSSSPLVDELKIWSESEMERDRGKAEMNKVHVIYRASNLSRVYCQVRCSQVHSSGFGFRCTFLLFRSFCIVLSSPLYRSSGCWFLCVGWHW